MTGILRDLELRHVSRIEAGGSGGWQLRLPLGFPIAARKAYFSDQIYGGKNAALDAARTERNAMFEQAKIPLREESSPRLRPGVRNRSGLVGVCFARTVREPLGFWEAHWSLNKVHYKSRFRVAAHSYELAFWKAVELRQTMTGLLFTNEDLGRALRVNRR